MLRRRSWVWGAAVLVLGTGYTVKHPTEATVSIINATRPTQCAEEDNVYVKLQGEGLRRLRVEAHHPRYMSTVRADSYSPDFTNCKFSAESSPTDPKYTFTPKRVVLWETDKFLMVGNTYATFWRPNKVDVVVSGTVTPEVHLVQLYLKDKDEPKLGKHQFLVLYPPDGYWRAKPIPKLPLNYGVYGTSFLVGPVEEGVRPVVDLTRVEFVPEAMTFKLSYRDGSHGELKIADVSREEIALDYAHDRALPSRKPLAAIRSMYVQPEKSDAAEVSWRAGSAHELVTQALPRFSTAEAVEVNFGRSVLSRHNSSAPDIWFGEFSR
jgi:hypothetical protein